METSGIVESGRNHFFKTRWTEVRERGGGKTVNAPDAGAGFEEFGDLVGIGDVLFARDEEVDMSAPPTAMYAKSSAFFNKSLAKASPQDTDKVLQPSIFDYMACSRVWAELNHMRRPTSKQHLYGYDKFCQPDGSLNKDSVDTLKAKRNQVVAQR